MKSNLIRTINGQVITDKTLLPAEKPLPLIDKDSVYSIKFAAAFMGMSPANVRVLQKRGIVPEPIYRGRNGRRIYTPLQLRLLEIASSVFGRKDRLEMASFLNEHWADAA